MKTPRITRLLKLLRILETGGTHNAVSLSKTCGVSRRTVFRDLETLREAGIRLQYDRRTDCYALADAAPITPTQLSTDEAISLIVLARQMGGGQHVPYFSAAGEAARKLEHGLPQATKQQLADVTAAVTMVPGGLADADNKAEVFRQLLEARRLRQVLRMEYESLTEWDTISTKLRPYQLMHSRHSWYVVGRSSAHREVRTFKVSRISSLELLDEKYKLPRGFSLKRYLKNAWRIVPESGKDVNVVVRFSPLVATNVREVVWHPTQHLVAQDDGSLLFHATVSGVNEISWWILGYADQAEVLKPARLRKLVAQRARSLARLYDR